MASTNLPDFTKYSDEKLEAARVAVISELERRAWGGTVQSQVQALAQQYVAQGGSLDDLTLEPPAPIEAPEQPDTPVEENDQADESPA